MAHNGAVRLLALPVLACLCGLAVAGCGGAGDGGTTSSPPTTAPDAAATTAAAPDLRGVAIAVRRDPG